MFVLLGLLMPCNYMTGSFQQETFGSAFVDTVDEVVFLITCPGISNFGMIMKRGIYGNKTRCNLLGQNV
jgi:hypothetical protein